MYSKKFKAEFQVRGYELDGYGHVNHSVYLNYAEFARWCMIEEVAGGDLFSRNGLSPIVVRVEADYREPCELADWVRVETRLIEFRSRALRFEQKVIRKKNEKTAAEILVTVMCENASGKAASLPSSFEKAFGGE